MSKFGRHYPVLGHKNTRRQAYAFFFAGGAMLLIFLLLILVITTKRNALGRKNVEVSDKISELARTGSQLVRVVVAKRPIPAGSKITTDYLQLSDWPRDKVPPHSLNRAIEAVGKFARVSIPANTPILRTSLTTTRTGVALPVSPGFRAVTIAVDAVSIVEGHALPGTHVDVVLTYTGTGGELKSKIIVQNVRVLSLGGDTTPIDERQNFNARRAQSSRTVTLEVTPEDALKIRTAQKLGALSLILRALEDNTPSKVTEISKRGIEGKSAPTTRPQGCQKGRVRISGKEYILECDGSLTEVVENWEP